MPELDQESTTPPEPVGWEQALAESFSKSSKAASEPDPSAVIPTDKPTGESVVEESKDALQPLEKWNDSVKTSFRSLDKTLQQFVLDREKDTESHLTKRTQELSDIQKRYERIDGVLKPYYELAQRSGVDLAPVLGQALNYYSSYQRDPLATVKYLIQAGQLTQEALFGAVNDETTDPATRALRAQLEQTQREVANLRQGQSQAVESQYSQQIQAFKDAKDEQGALKYPHFEQLRELMAPLVNKGKSLEDAYAESVWTVKEFREAHEKAEIEKREKEAKKAADKARMEKVRAAKTAETLPSSDADKGTAKKDFKGWEKALLETFQRSTA